MATKVVLSKKIFEKIYLNGKRKYWNREVIVETLMLWHTSKAKRIMNSDVKIHVHLLLFLTRKKCVLCQHSVQLKHCQIGMYKNYGFFDMILVLNGYIPIAAFIILTNRKLGSALLKQGKKAFIMQLQSTFSTWHIIRFMMKKY